MVSVPNRLIFPIVVERYPERFWLACRLSVVYNVATVYYTPRQSKRGSDEWQTKMKPCAMRSWRY